MEEIAHSVREYILREFLPGEDPSALTDSTPLIAGGILDSLATLRLVSFLEQQFRVTLAPHETDEEHLGTISTIVNLVQSKL
jgi:acyl carrier protein